MFHCYILKSIINNSYYIGSCQNLQNRITLHNRHIVPSTKRYAPWKLVYSEDFDNSIKARRRELQIKSWKSRIAIERLFSKTF